MVAGLQDARARHHQEVPGVAAGEVVEGDVELVRRDLVAQPVPVVVLDQARGDLTAVDRRDDRLVVVVGLAVVLQALQPLLRRVLALQGGDRGDERLEVGLGRREPEAALPLRLRQVEQRRRQVGGRELAGVVDEHRGARGHADPVPLGRALGLRDRGQRQRRDGRQQPLLVERLQRR